VIHLEQILHLIWHFAGIMCMLHGSETMMKGHNSC